MASAGDREFVMARYVVQFGIGRVKIKAALYGEEEFKVLIRASSSGCHQMGRPRTSEMQDTGVVIMDHRDGTSNL